MESLNKYHPLALLGGVAVGMYVLGGALKKLAIPAFAGGAVWWFWKKNPGVFSSGDSEEIDDEI